MLKYKLNLAQAPKGLEHCVLYRGGLVTCAVEPKVAVCCNHTEALQAVLGLCEYVLSGFDVERLHVEAVGRVEL